VIINSYTIVRSSIALYTITTKIIKGMKITPGRYINFTKLVEQLDNNFLRSIIYLGTTYHHFLNRR